MENYTSGNFGKVYSIMGDSLDVVGKGDVRLKLSGNTTWILRDVKHIPGLAWNLISTGLLSDKGYRIRLSDGCWKVSTGDFEFTVSLDADPSERMSTYLSPSPVSRCV